MATNGKKHGAAKESNNEHGIECKVWDFKCHKIPSVHWNGQDVFPARYVGRAIEQGDDGKQFTRNVTEEGTEGVDFLRATGVIAVRIEQALVSARNSNGGNCPPLENQGVTDHGRAKGAEIILLTESGLHLGLLKTRKPIGKALRLWLAREVLPALRKSGSYSTPNAFDPAQLSNAILKIQDLEARLASVEKAAQNDVGLISEEWAEENIKAPIRRIGLLRAGSSDKKEIRRHRRAAENQIRNIVCFNGKGSKWTNYPRDAQLIRILTTVIKNMMDGAIEHATSEVRQRADAKARAETEARLKQLGLFDHRKAAN